MRPFTVRALYAATAFLAAALVFLVQPMVAKQLLPTFGGAPSVWNTAVVFFQVVLLCGYAFAHVTLRLLGPRRQVFAQVGLALVALAFLPFAVRTGSTPPSGVPDAVWVAALLALAVGVPYLAMTTASVVLQRWYAELGLADSSEPWFLYSASNAGSLVGLLAFPFLLEPTLTTAWQERAWAITFVVYLAGLLACARQLRRSSAGEPDLADAAGVLDDGGAAPREGAAAIGRLRALRWVGVAAVPSALMLGVTTFITTDVANAPMLWVLPLALYLVSFMVTFGRRVQLGTGLAGALLAPCVVLLLLVELEVASMGELARVVLHLLAMLLAAVLAHAWLYADRPAARHLTTFYLLLSVGGALGGTFTALVAPAVFSHVYEYPLLLVFALVLRPAPWRAGGSGWGARAWVRATLSVIELALAGALVLALAEAATSDDSFGAPAPGTWGLLGLCVGFAVLAARRWGFVVAVATLLMLFTVAGNRDAEVLHQERNFFGSLRVEGNDSNHRLLHGTTLHGLQLRGDDVRDEPGTYYSQEGPVGDVFERLQQDAPFERVGAVGLGTGTLATYAREDQHFTFFEIDPAVIDVAEDPRWFTFLDDARARAEVDVVEGDARLELEERDDRFDLLVLDAYSSDAVPVHLLTVEALRLYERRLAQGGVLAFHISSRHLDLVPVLAAGTQRLELVARIRFDRELSEEQRALGANRSQWVAVARDADRLAALDAEAGWEELPRAADDRAWTDDFSNLARTITWLPGHG